MDGSEVESEAGGTADQAKRVLGRGSVFTIATVFQLGAGILIIPVLTRTVDPEEYGLITAALVVQAVAATVAAFGAPAAVQRTYFRRGGPEGARALICAVAAAAVLFAVLAELTGPLWSQVFEGVDYGAELRLAVLAAVPNAIMLAAQTFLQAAERARIYVICAVISTAGGQVLGLALTLLDHGATGYLAGIAIGFWAGAIVAWFAAGFDAEPLRRARGGRDLLRRALLVGLPTVPSALALYLLSAGDRVVVERLEGLAAAGAYYIAYAVGSLAIFLVTALNTAWGPILFGVDRKDRWTLLAASAVEVTRVVALAAAALAVGAPIALELFAPADYAIDGLGTVSALIAVSSVLYVWYITSYNVILWRGRTGTLAWATPLSTAANLGLCAALIPPMGLEGAALATFVSYGLLALLTWGRARTMADVPWDVGALARSAAPAAIGLALALALPDDGGWIALRGVLAAGFGLWALGLLAVSLRHSRSGSVPA
jgi:O-antigen/teichoic acid export membrane protein